jgi:hypothetical protein
MLANLMGSVVMAWSVFRILRPSRAALAADTAARLLFSLGMAAALIQGAWPVVLGMLILEVLWEIVQGLVVLSSRRRLVAQGRLVKIAKLAERAVMKVSTVRSYGRLGVLAEPARTSSG